MPIAWFHFTSGAMSSAAHSGLLLFCALLVTFATAHPDRSNVARAKRMLIPWLVWSLIYGVGRTLERVRNGEPLFAWWEPHMLISGTMMHLWFLPFALGCAVVAVEFARRGLLDRVRHIYVAIPLVVVFHFLGAVGFSEIPASPPLTQYIFAVPALVLGLVLPPTGGGRPLLPVVLAGAAVLGAAAAIPIDGGSYLSKSWMYCVGISVVWWPTLRAGTVLLTLGRLSLTIYLAHIAVSDVVKLVVPDSSELAGNLASLAATVAFAFVVDSAGRRLHSVRKTWAARSREPSGIVGKGSR